MVPEMIEKMQGDLSEMHREWDELEAAQKALDENKCRIEKRISDAYRLWLNACASVSREGEAPDAAPPPDLNGPEPSEKPDKPVYPVGAVEISKANGREENLKRIALANGGKVHYAAATTLLIAEGVSNGTQTGVQSGIHKKLTQLPEWEMLGGGFFRYLGEGAPAPAPAPA